MSEWQDEDDEWRFANSGLAEGIAALKAGRRDEARRLLAQAVYADPEDAAAWLWLSRCVDDARQRRDCLERVLRLNPDNAEAQRTLGQGAGARLRQIMAADVKASVNRAFYSSLELREANTMPAVSPDSPGSVPHVEEPKDTVVSSLRAEAELAAVGGRSSNRSRRRLALAALAVVLIALAYVSVPRLGWLGSQAQPVGSQVLEASGVIRADEVLIASEWSGRIAAIPVVEGDTVVAGDLLVQLDMALLDAQIEVARAAVAVAEAALERAQAGTRAGQVAVAEAQLNQAEAARIASAQAVSDTLALVENPQEIRLQIAVAQAQAEAAQHHVARAVALKDAAGIGKDKFEEVQEKWGGGGRRRVLVRSGDISELPAMLPPEIVALLPSLGDGVYTFGDLELHLHGGTFDLYKWINASDVHIPLDLHLMPNAWWQAWVGVNAAVAQQEGIKASLAQLYAQRAHPQNLEVKADEAVAALAQAEAQVTAAQVQLEGLLAGATDEQIAALEARVAQARAALNSLLVQRAKMEIVSPVDGVVVDMAAHAGEVMSAGAALLTVADLSEVRLVVYLPETQIGQVRLSQSVQVKVDSFPDRAFEGQVTYIADRAEFTPRNVATKEERVNLVFAVEVRLPNNDGALKPGMPADAVFGE